MAASTIPRGALNACAERGNTPAIDCGEGGQRERPNGKRLAYFSRIALPHSAPTLYANGKCKHLTEWETRATFLCMKTCRKCGSHDFYNYSRNGHHTRLCKACTKERSRLARRILIGTVRTSEEYTCPICGGHDGCAFQGTKNRVFVVCRTCVSTHRPRENGWKQDSSTGEFICPKCGSRESKVYTDERGLHRRCSACIRAYRKAYDKTHIRPPRSKKPPKPRKAKLTDQQKRELRVNGILNGNPLECAICHKALTFRSACVDHCHESGETRGILCGHCNCGIGFFEDSPKRLEAAIAYLKNP